MEMIGAIWIRSDYLRYLLELNEEIKNSQYSNTGKRGNPGYTEIYISKDFLEKCMYYLSQIKETYWTKEIKEYLQSEINELIRTNRW